MMTPQPSGVSTWTPAGTSIPRVSRPGGLPQARSTMSVSCGSRYRKSAGRSRVARPRDRVGVPALAASGRGFGIVAGTGTGKTLAIRPIATTILQAPLKVGVVNREREATPETPTWNVVIVTTGIARRWFEDGLITARDTLVVDEIHQTSAELEP